MQNKIEVNGMEIEYDDALLEKIRQSSGLSADTPISQAEIISFFQETMNVAINKGYAIIEDEPQQGKVGSIPSF